MAALYAVRLIKPNNDAPASYATAPIPTLLNVCAVFTSRFIHSLGLLKTTVVFIQSHRGQKVADNLPYRFTPPAAV